MSPRARKLSDNDPPLEKLAAGIIPLGIQAGKIVGDGNGGYVIDQELLGYVAPYLTNRGILGLPKKRRHWREKKDRTKYIEEVLKVAEKNREQKSVRCLYRETSLWEQKYGLPPLLGMGLVAVHLYYQNP